MIDYPKPDFSKQTKVWDDWLFESTEQKARLVILNKKFQQAVRGIREEAGIPPGGFKTYQEARHWVEAKTYYRCSEWTEQINNLLERCKMMAGWRQFIELYIIGSRVMAPPAILIHDSPDEFGVPQLTLTINDFTDNRDLTGLQASIKAWREVWGYADQIKRNPYPKLQWYARMYNLRAQGYTNAQIAEKLRQETEGQEISVTFTTKSVREDLARYQKLIDSQTV